VPLSGGTAAAVADTENVDSLQARVCETTGGGGGCTGTVNTDTCKVTSAACQSGACCTSRCSGWVTFRGLSAGQTSPKQWQIYSSKFDGSSTLATTLDTIRCGTTTDKSQPFIATGLANTQSGRRVGHSFTLPLQQLVYFTATLSDGGQGLHVVQAGTSTVNTISKTPAAPIAKGGVWVGNAASRVCIGAAGAEVETVLPGTHSRPSLSPDGKYFILQSQTVTTAWCGSPLAACTGGSAAQISRPVAETFLAKADGTGTPLKISPVLDADHTSGGIGLSVAATGGTADNDAFLWTRDSAYAVFAVADQSLNSGATAFATSGRARDQLWSVQSAATAPKVFNLTAQTTTPLANYVRGMGSVQFDNCNHRRLIFLANLPEDGSPTQIHSQLVDGGNTVLVSFDPAKGVAVTAYSLLTGQSAVGWSANYFSASSTDLFANRASSSILAPAIALLALMVDLLAQ